MEEEFERSQVIFSGKVVEVKEKRSLKGYVTKSVLFEVTKTWKDASQSQIIITTGQGDGDCGIDFKEGEDYLVYANESTMYGAESLVSNICSRTNELSASQEDLVILGEGNEPVEKIDLTSKDNQFYIWVIVVAVIIGFLFWYKKHGTY
ncbi:hypothetical protein [Niallia sp. Krafla_26]|uniref:hypothetical protein n=1 Tax=Niallia sp. Krafla_26 TaxID=3064703 RepID=UPI003D164698